MASRNVPEIVGQGDYKMVSVNGYTYFVATETGPSFPRGFGQTTVSHFYYDTAGKPNFEVIGTFHYASDAVAAATADSNQREAHAALGEALGCKESCYSDHNEDIRTKGICFYCGGKEPLKD